MLAEPLSLIFYHSLNYLWTETYQAIHKGQKIMIWVQNSSPLREAEDIGSIQSSRFH